jgi:hypothetical protein
MIDESTKPTCEFITKVFDWGEPYLSYNPVFEMSDLNGDSDLEKSIQFFGKNNFKKQLLLLYNSILNFQENEINNVDITIDNRERLLNLLQFYLEQNANFISPWEKYGESLSETDYIEKIKGELLFELCYVEE